MNELIGRAYLEDAIGKAQRRNAARAARDLKMRAEKVRDDAAMFVAENPFTAMAGSLVIGLFIGSMIPKTRLGAKILALGDIAAQAGIAYGQQAFNSARRLSERGIERDQTDEQA